MKEKKGKGFKDTGPKKVKKGHLLDKVGQSILSQGTAHTVECNKDGLQDLLFRNHMFCNMGPHPFVLERKLVLTKAK